MREGWTYKKLREVCDFINDGDWIESKDQSESGIRLIQTGNIGNGIFKDKEERAKFISHETFSRLGCTEIFEGDCLVSRLPEPIGRCCVLPPLDSRCITAVDCSILRFKDFVIPKYFVYYSQSSKYAIDIENKTTGTTRKRISRKNLESIQIPLPPIPQQRLIVSELDKINSLIALKREQLKKYDELAQSLFYEMFGDPVENEKGWEVKNYGNEFEIGSGGTPSKTKPEYWQNGNIPWIGSNMCQNCIITETDGKYITQSGLDHSSAKLLSTGSVIVALVGATIGKVALLKTVTTTNQNIAFIKVEQNKDYTSEFVYYHLMSLYEEFMNIGNGDFKMANLSFIRSLKIVKPPLSLQHLFAQRVEQIEEQKKQVTAAIAKLETLLASRMQYWFE